MAGNHSRTQARPEQQTGLRLLSARNYLRHVTSVVAARDHAVSVAGDLTDPDALKLCVSELVTNSIKHAESGHITVVFWHLYGAGLLRCEVIDDGGPTTPVTSYNLEANCGRGLFLVENTAIEWDFYTDAAGCTTWFTLAALQIVPDVP